MIKISWFSLVSIFILMMVIGGFIYLYFVPPPITFSHEYRLEQEIDLLEKQIEISQGESVPQWFIDDFKRVFMGSYNIQVEDDSLCVIIATNRSDFYGLAESLGFPNPMATDVYLDIVKWEYWYPDDEITIEIEDDANG